MTPVLWPLGHEGRSRYDILKEALAKMLSQQTVRVSRATDESDCSEFAHPHIEPILSGRAYRQVERTPARWAISSRSFVAIAVYRSASFSEYQA